MTLSFRSRSESERAPVTRNEEETEDAREQQQAAGRQRYGARREGQVQRIQTDIELVCRRCHDVREVVAGGDLEGLRLRGIGTGPGREDVRTGGCLEAEGA